MEKKIFKKISKERYKAPQQRKTTSGHFKNLSEELPFFEFFLFCIFIFLIFQFNVQNKWRSFFFDSRS